MSRRPRILLVMLEFCDWDTASRWGYLSNMGMEYGLVANDFEYLILPATHRYRGHIPFWVDHTRSLLGSRTFDQVWFEVVHSSLDDSTLQFFTEVAPIRLGFAFESLELLPIQSQKDPSASQIREEVLRRHLAVATHLVTCDELDAIRLTGNHFDTKPMPPGFVIPSAFLDIPTPPPQLPFGLFYGTPYGERAAWLAHPELRSVLRFVERSLELDTELPQAFDLLHFHTINLLRSGYGDLEILGSYLKSNQRLRAACFDLWLSSLQAGAAVVNLPQLNRAFAGRVVEGMAAGRPVITQEIENRPLAKAAFEDGKEILLYRTPEELAERLTRVIHDPGYGRRIAEAAREKLRRTHRMEDYFADLFRWTSGKSLPSSESSVFTR